MRRVVPCSRSLSIGTFSGLEIAVHAFKIMPFPQRVQNPARGDCVHMCEAAVAVEWGGKVQVWASVHVFADLPPPLHTEIQIS